jgi:Zn-dependent peptidase ImmA (M78 family)
MPSHSDEGFEQLAKTVRLALCIDDQVKLDALDFLRRLKHAGYIKDYVRLPDASLPDAEAKYNPDDQKIYVGASACAGAANDIPHYRFTVFHEGSHAVLRHQYERKRSVGLRALAERKVYTIRIDEDDANKLAATIMAPFHKADFCLQMTPAQIADRFGLSLPAA